MPSLTLVHVADQTADGVAASLLGHLEALAHVEALGVDVDGYLVAATPDPRVRRMLHAVDGARIVALSGAAPVGACWEDGWRSTRADFVYLATAASVPEPGAIAALVTCLLEDPCLAAAYPVSSAPPAALVRRSALEATARGGGRALRKGRQPVLVLESLHRRLTREGFDVAVVPGATVSGLPLRQQPTVLTPGWANVQLAVAHPAAVTVGPYTYFTGTGARIVTYSPMERVEIGSYCSIADDVRLVNPHDPRDPVTFPDGAVRHPLARVAHRPGTATTLPIGNRFHHLEGFDDVDELAGAGATMRVGSDVWVGYGATVLGPVNVGHGAVIGAGAVVTRDVEPYAVVAGNPARAVRRRFDDATVAALLRIAWWDWTEAEVMRHAEAFLRPAEEFAARFDPAARRLAG